MGAPWDDGEHAKDEGMARAIENAWDRWREGFRAEVARLAGTGRPFTSEQVTAAVGLPTGVISLSANNAVGALINAAARRGVIRKTGRRVKSARPTSHAAELTEWIGTTKGMGMDDQSISQQLAGPGNWTELQDKDEMGLSGDDEMVAHVAIEGGTVTDMEGVTPVIRLTLATTTNQVRAFMGVADARRLAQGILEVIEAGL